MLLQLEFVAVSYVLMTSSNIDMERDVIRLTHADFLKVNEELEKGDNPKLKSLVSSLLGMLSSFESSGVEADESEPSDESILSGGEHSELPLLTPRRSPSLIVEIDAEDSQSTSGEGKEKRATHLQYRKEDKQETWRRAELKREDDAGFARKRTRKSRISHPPQQMVKEQVQPPHSPGLEELKELFHELNNKSLLVEKPKEQTARAKPRDDHHCEQARKLMKHWPSRRKL